MQWLAESLAAVRAEEADDLAARLAEAKLHLVELEALPPGSHQSQATVSRTSDSNQTRQWLPRAISDAASHAMYPTAKLRVTQVQWWQKSAHTVKGTLMCRAVNSALLQNSMCR